MTATRQIIGAKGGSGGSSFVSKPDTLRSNDSFEILLGLGSGRWKGLVNGLKGLKINGVPMENADGTSNFENVVALFADGNPLEQQLVNFKLGGGGATQQVGTALANPNGAGPGPWVSGAVSTQNADFIDLRFVVQSLFYQDTKSIRENTANLEIEMRPSNSSTWTNIFTAPASNTTTYDPNGYDMASDYEDYAVGKTLFLGRSLFNVNGTGYVASNNPYLQIRGKTSSAFVKELRVAVPKNGNYANVGWEVRARLVEKDTNDNGDIQERRSIGFESITAVIKQPLGDDPAWAGQVWMQIYGKASDQFNGFPEIQGVFDTKICQTPPLSVWNPDTRQYTGATWDGSYEEHFTTDPAWQLKEFVEDPIHGLAGLQPGSTLDKWDALEASKYYSELVPDGRGGTHPRFNLNLTLTEAQDVNELMSYLAGAVNSYTEDVGDGKWRLKVDKPETPKVVFTQDNIFGDFNYSHTDVDSRFNDWRGTFLNEDFDYNQDTVRIYDQSDVDENGTRFTEIALVGCTNRQEALRRLMFRMRIALNEYKIVRFQTNRLGRYIGPLDTILVADGALNADHLVKSTSRIGSYAGTTVNLLRPVRLEVGVNYTIKFTTTDKQVITRTVTNVAGARGDVTAIAIDTALPNNIMAQSAVSLEAVGLPSNPVSYRVIAVERSEENEDEYSITASIIDSGKWNAMDNVSEAEIQAQVAAPGIDAPTAPQDGMFDVLVYATDFDLKRALQVNWNRPGSLFLDGFKVEYRINDGPYKVLSENLKDSVIELEDPQDGVYDFKITALDRRGYVSNPLVGRYELVGSRELTAPTHLRGTLANRPATAPYDGFRYTVTDGAVPTTHVWEGGQWKSETNLVTKGSDIGVEDGATVGMTDAEAAIQASHTTQLSSITTDISDLHNMYGDVASASSSATLAEQFKQAAETAKSQTEAIKASVEGTANLVSAKSDLVSKQVQAISPRTLVDGVLTISHTGFNPAPLPNGQIVNGSYTATGEQGGVIAPYYVYHSSLFPYAPGQVYRVTAVVKSANAAPANHGLVGVVYLDTNAQPISSSYLGNLSPIGTDPTTLRGDTTAATVPAGTAYVRFFAIYNRDASQATNAATTTLSALYVDDVTSEKAAQASATTASGAAADALTYKSQAFDSKELAASSEAAALGYKNTAQGAANDALAYSNTASAKATEATGAASDALGAKAAAYTSQTQAAQSATDALGYKNSAAASASTASGAATDALNAKASAYSSQQLAATSAASAQTAANSASDNATLADQQRALAVTASNLAAQYRNEAEGFKNTASNAATTAGQQATAAQGYASTAQTQAGIATTKAGDATTAAGNALTYQNNASNSAAAALLSQQLSASVATGAINLDPSFTEFTGIGGIWLPDRWRGYDNSNSGYMSRVTGPLGIGYGWRQQAPAESVCYGSQQLTSQFKIGSYWVIEADIRHNAGVLDGAGVYFVVANTGYKLSFKNDPDATGIPPGSGIAGTSLKFRKLIKLTEGGTGGWLYAMSHWSGFGDSLSSASDITFDRVAVRPATIQEIETLKIASLEAEVKIAAGAAASAAGRTTAFWSLEANAGSATSFITARADTQVHTSYPINWTPINGAAAVGRKIGAIAAAGWTAGIVSKESYTGSAYLECTVAHPSAVAMIGLKGTAAAPTDYSQLDYALYWVNDYWMIYESGTYQGLVATALITDRPSIEYKSDGTILYKINDKVVRTVNAGTGRTFYAAGSFGNSYMAFDNVSFMPSAPGISSTVAIGAAEFSVWNPAGNAWKRAMTIANGNALFAGGLQAGAFIRLGTGEGWPVALKPRNFQVSDGTVVSFGTTLDNLPTLAWQGNGLVALGSGQIYRLYAENLTTSGFTARVKLVTPAAPSNYTLTTSTSPGSGPTRQIDKAGYANATDGNYRISYSGQMTLNSFYS